MRFLSLCVVGFSALIIALHAKADTRPLPSNACDLDHRALIEDYIHGEFENMQNLGELVDDDELRTVVPHKQDHLTTEDGDVTYQVRPYGKAGTPFPVESDSGSPDEQSEFRCYAQVIVTSSCQVVAAPLDFMDNEKLEKLKDDALIEMEQEAHRQGKRLEYDEKGGIAVGVTVPKYHRMTCDRPPVMMAF